MFSGFMHGNFTLPMYDTAIGMGDDILGTLNFYGLGDPFYLLTSFIPVKLFPYFFTFLFYFRLYLAGMCAILFTRKLIPAKSVWSYVTAAILFCCSGFAIEANVHIIFVHALMYLPLILWAIDSFLSHDSHSTIWLVLSVCGLAMTGIFYLYIIALTAAFYALYRWISFYRKNNCKFSRLIYTGLICLIGIGLSSIVLLPSIQAFSGDSRNAAAETTLLHLFFDFDEIRYQYYRFFYVSDNVIGKASVAAPGLISILVVLFSNKHKQSKLIILLSLFAYNSQLVRWVMSGARNSTYNRWEFVLALIFSAMVVVAWDELKSLSKLQIISIIGCFLLIICIGFLDKTLVEHCYRNYILAYFLYLIILLLIQFKNLNCSKLLSFSLVSAGILCTMLTWYTTMPNYPLDSLTIGRKDFIDTKILDSDSSFYRIEDSDTILLRNFAVNNSMLYNYSNTAEYFSIDNPRYRSARDSWGLGDSYYIVGVDSRTILENMLCSKYLLVRDGEDLLIPYGYEYIFSDFTPDNENILVYKNNNSLPMMYVYEKVVDYAEYSNCDPIDRQISMLDSIALDGYDSESIPLSPTYATADSDCLVSYNDHQYVIECQCPAGYESYLVVDCDTDSHISQIKINELVKYYSYDKLNYINLGYHQDDSVVYVQLSCDFALDDSDFSIKCIDMSSVDKKLSILANNGLSDILIDTNTISAQSNRSSDGLLCLSLPHTQGWSAYIDGKETKIYTANDLFMGINLPAGNHNIEFRYITPGLKTGALLSLLSLTALLVIAIINKRLYSTK